MRLLIIEDDEDLAKTLKRSFEAESFTVDHYLDGEEGCFMAKTSEYDVAILDYSLPNKNGLVICKEIRSSGKNYPIIFLSVIGEVSRKVDALDKGADDFVVKPFLFKELLSRVKAVLRRPQTLSYDIVTNGKVTLDTKSQKVLCNNKSIYLTKKEYNLFEYLMKNPETVLSRTNILEHVWSADLDPFSNTVESHVLNLRKKVCSRKTGLSIKNIPGRGYVLTKFDKNLNKNS